MMDYFTVATFVYDGDGNRVKSTINTTTTTFIGNHTEWKVGAASQPTRYYNAGGMRLATRLDGVMYYPLKVHLPHFPRPPFLHGENFDIPSFP